MKEQGQEVEEYESDLDDSPLLSGGGQREALAAKEGWRLDPTRTPTTGRCRDV
jgi:hypothetical protein